MTHPSPTRVALVAGAGRGIGAEIAKAFARSGAAVVLGARDDRALLGVDPDAEAVLRELDAQSLRWRGKPPKVGRGTY